jgi:hypothetical protein
LSEVPIHIVLTAAMSLLSALCLFVLNAVFKKIENIEKSIFIIQTQCVAHAERIAKVETNVENLKDKKER